MPATAQRIDTQPIQLVTAALAAAFGDPRHTAPADAAQQQHLRDAWRTLAAPHAGRSTGELGLGELPPAEVDIQPLCRWLAMPQSQREAAWLHVFGLVISRQCPPYETEYCHWKDPTYRAHQLADIAGFFNAFGLEAHRDRPERADHVSLELEFIALLAWKLDHTQLENNDDATAICRDALTWFVRDHAIWWMPTFARCVQQRIETQPIVDAAPSQRDALDAMVGVADALRAWTAAVRLVVGIEPCRQIIAPQVDPQPVDDDCEKCTTC